MHVEIWQNVSADISKVIAASFYFFPTHDDAPRLYSCFFGEVLYGFNYTHANQ